ncbi:oxygenase MpaB family protein [Actinomadura oligospora]|uniref:oxygenase MpaB family protein n=1 Tax=Actinomadura oligospora TaxID=111804 RepID=UPI0004B10971|nr:oxygenase MpaB family protein [Actinomadura oligospora]
MTSAPTLPLAAGSGPDGPGAAGEPIPRVVRELVSGPSLAAGGANVIMQLSRLPVGLGVVESKVESGRIDRHPVKRTRTTLTYLIVAMLGGPDERVWMREEINRQHRRVRSEPGADVRYNAFDRELQLWVAACIYWGMEDVYRRFYGEPSEAALADFYRHGRRFATTLQVPDDMWPESREAFEEYWRDGLAKLSSTPETRAYLRGIAKAAFLPRSVQRVVGPANRLLTVGFLPPEFREELGFTWTARDQRAFDAGVRALALANRTMPRPMREFPFNAYLWDFRRRMRTGRSFV